MEPIEADDAWTRASGQWLVHCTRGCHGPWPEQTFNQYRDSMLLGTAQAARRGPLDALERIVRSRRLIASATTTEFPVVCFSSLPLQTIIKKRCFRPHLQRWDYEPFGIAIRRTAALRLGIQPVIYGDSKQRTGMRPHDRFRFQSQGTTFDWREEKEWRSPATIQLQRLGVDEVRVFAADIPGARTKLAKCPWPVTFLTATDSLEHASSSEKAV